LYSCKLEAFIVQALKASKRPMIDLMFNNKTRKQLPRIGLEAYYAKPKGKPRLH